jgi:hypothetical protein
MCFRNISLYAKSGKAVKYLCCVIGTLSQRFHSLRFLRSSNPLFLARLCHSALHVDIFAAEFYLSSDLYSIVELSI